MWSIFLLCLISFSIYAENETNFQGKYGSVVYQDNCVEDQYVVYEFRRRFDDFILKFFQKAAEQGNYYLTVSPYMTWIILAGIAEGADQQTQNEIFKVLNLPRNFCSRQKFYYLARSRISNDKYFNLVQRRALFIDHSIEIKYNATPSQTYLFRDLLLEAVQVPIKVNPDSASNIIRQHMSLQRRGLDLSGNSVLVDSMDYNGFWTTSFGDAVIQRSAFYSTSGTRIGSVDLMRVKRRVRVGPSISIFSKFVEIPIGDRGQYRMLIGLFADGSNATDINVLDKNIIVEVVNSLHDSVVPIDVAIPQFVMTSEIDIKSVLQDMGINSLWRDPRATRHISNPPALPSSYIQRVRVNLNTVGINPPPRPEKPLRPVKEDRNAREFIADRPFAMGIYDAETFTNLMAMMYTQPTYLY